MPTFFTILIWFFIYLKLDYTGNLKPIEIVTWTLFFLFAVGLFIFLFFNHLPLARQTQLIVVDKTFQIIQGDSSYIGNLSEILEIIEYSSKKLPWGLVMKWNIKTAESEIVISSLTISQHSFQRHFKNKIKQKVSLMPTI